MFKQVVLQQRSNVYFGMVIGAVSFLAGSGFAAKAVAQPPGEKVGAAVVAAAAFIYAAICARICVMRVVVRATGVTIVNLMQTHELEWNEITDIRLVMDDWYWAKQVDIEGEDFVITATALASRVASGPRTYYVDNGYHVLVSRWRNNRRSRRHADP